MPNKITVFETRLDQIAQQMDVVLARLLPEPVGPQAQVMEAMRYAALGGGKRLRPFLLIETARMLGYESLGVEIAAGALECVHVYSLIHDDLPCMDDDDIRRGKPTVHKAYDEAMAVLAGDALLTIAFEIMARPEIHADANIRLKLLSSLAQASGTHGMIGGQIIDINAPHFSDDKKQDEELITHLQALKTGALINYAVMSGARLAGASEDALMNLSAFSQNVGLAFQIRDDILDAEGDAVEMGKAAGKDAGLGKATFVSIHGLEGAKEKAYALGEQAKSMLIPYGAKADVLRATVDFVLNRKK